MFEIIEEQAAILKVIGLGGGGGNALSTMIEAGLENVEFIAVNTDRQVLAQNLASCKVQLGTGLGAGGNPAFGREAAVESKDRIREFVEGANMVFITAGMGGGTGTGAAPVVAQVARDVGALTVAVVTKPFPFEGKRRMLQAEEGIEELRNHVDSLIVIPNQKLIALAGKNMTMLEAFKKADEVLLNAVQSISDLITIPGMINLDMRDVETIMSDSGMALMGTGYAKGENRANDAANMAISGDLLENVAIFGAQGVLINITSGPDITMDEISEAVSNVQDVVAKDANIIFGVVVNPRMTEEMRVTVIATGFDQVAVMEPGRDDSQEEEPQMERVSYLQQRMAQRPPETRSQRPSILEKYRRTPEPEPEPEFKAAAAGAAGGPTRPAGIPSNVESKKWSDDDEYDVPPYIRRQPD
jgi:cell division protein FtsZ